MPPARTNGVTPAKAPRHARRDAIRARSRRAGTKILGVAALAAIGAATTASCGARSGLDAPPKKNLPECLVDADCPGFENKCRNIHCLATPDGEGGAGGVASAATGGLRDKPIHESGRCVETAPKDCDDGDVCTIDTCVPETGACKYDSAVQDNDGDTYFGPREGTKPGDPDSCGDDCDDTNPKAHPNGVEECDGVDNDCNGIVDDNMTFVPIDADAKRISDHPSASPGNIAYNGTNYAALFTESQPAPGSTDMFDAMLTDLGDKVPPGQQRVTAVNADSYAGSILWIGDRFGVVWQDRRDDDYEIYFTELDSKGDKIHADTRLTVAPEFSIYPDLGWTGSHFLTVWQDERDGIFNIYGQTLDIDGNPTSNNVQLTDAFAEGFPNEAPVIAATSQGVGVAWSRGDTFTHFIEFQRFGFDFTPLGPPIDLTDGSTESVYPSIVFNEDRYIVSWFDRSASPRAIYAAAIDLDGNVIVPKKAVTSPGSKHSRYPTMRALGDRVLLVYSDDRDDNQGYELYSRVFDNELNPISAERRVTNAKADSIYPRATFGPDGDVGVLFRDDRLGEQHVWFTRLGCVAATTPPP
jgi:hypothetical protein